MFQLYRTQLASAWIGSKSASNWPKLSECESRDGIYVALNGASTRSFPRLSHQLSVISSNPANTIFIIFFCIRVKVKFDFIETTGSDKRRLIELHLKKILYPFTILFIWCKMLPFLSSFVYYCMREFKLCPKSLLRVSSMGLQVLYKMEIFLAFR